MHLFSSHDLRTIGVLSLQHFLYFYHHFEHLIAENEINYWIFVFKRRKKKRIWLLLQTNFAHFPLSLVMHCIMPGCDCKIEHLTHLFKNISIQKSLNSYKSTFSTQSYWVSLQTYWASSIYSFTTPIHQFASQLWFMFVLTAPDKTE